MTRLVYLLGIGLLVCTTVLASPAWTTQASRPGPDIPAIGESRFDQLFLQSDGSFDIPFPLSRLIAFLETRVAHDTQKPVVHVLIPQGRSMLRNSGAPDFFRNPRSILSIQGEPAVDMDAGDHLKYRLFIAGQPKTGILEVISYNDELGRFEFQIVDNYLSGKKPELRYANRGLCMSCHQNGAAIFPVIPWSETNINAAVATQIIKALPETYPSLIGVVTKDAGFTDVLVDRANYLSLAQTIWRQGCDSIRCRAAIFRAALQYRLSDEAGFDRSNPGYHSDYLQPLESGWQNKWPQGLALATSRLINVDPFNSGAVNRSQDPLSLRPAQAIWKRPDPILADGIVERLASFFTRNDIQRIDRKLIQLSRLKPVTSRQLITDCRLEPSSENLDHIVCGDLEQDHSLQLTIELERDAQTIQSARILHLKFPDDSKIWQPEIENVTQDSSSLKLEPGGGKSGLSQRLVNGERIESIKLVTNADRNEFSKVSISLSDESTFIDRLVEDAIKANRSGQSNSLSNRAFRRPALLSDIYQTLAIEGPGWTGAPVASNKKAFVASAMALPGALNLMNVYCADCHSEILSNPPAFLGGKNIEQNLLACAPRIIRRLNAWQTDSITAVVAMPPPASIGRYGLTGKSWPASDNYRSLLAAFEKLIEDSGEYEVTDLDHRPYADLPACKPVH